MRVDKGSRKMIKRGRRNDMIKSKKKMGIVGGAGKGWVV